MFLKKSRDNNSKSAAEKRKRITLCGDWNISFMEDSARL
jgi:hypothetical protein